MSKEEQLKKGFSTEYEWISDMKITLERLRQIITEEVIKEEINEVILESPQIPDLKKAGPELEELIQQVMPAIEQATEGNPELKKLSLERLFQLLQKQSGVKIP